MTAAAFMVRVHVVYVGVDEATEAALLAARHRRRLADTVILAAACRHGATLVSPDADFERVDGVAYRPHEVR